MSQRKTGCVVRLLGVVCLALVWYGCTSESALPLPSGGDAATPETTEPPDVALEMGPAGEAGDTADASGAVTCDDLYPGTSRADSSGMTFSWWRFDWRQDDLASICASYGNDAKMVLEVWLKGVAGDNTLPVCSLSDVLGYGDHVCAKNGMGRLEADCNAGQILFEASGGYPALMGPGYFHMESTQVPAPPRRSVVADQACGRALHPRFIPMAPAGSPDTGVDTGWGWEDDYDPSVNGQPCGNDVDCPRSYQRCFTDAVVTDCQNRPVGRCIPSLGPSNMCALGNDCASCLGSFGIALCWNYPGTVCGWGSRAPCLACIPRVDGGP